MVSKKREDWQDLLWTLGQIGVVMLVLFFVLVLSAFPFRSAYFGDIRPSFILMVIYAWTITRPGTISSVTAFIVGLIFDLLVDYPLGLSALTFLLAQILTQTQRRFLLGQPFLVIWAGMGAVALGAGLLQWIIFCLLGFTFVPIMPVIMSVIMTAVLFPLVMPLIAGINKKLAERPSSR